MKASAILSRNFQAEGRKRKSESRAKQRTKRAKRESNGSRNRKNHGHNLPEKVHLKNTFSSNDVRNEALRNVFQFWKQPLDGTPLSLAVCDEMRKVYGELERDLHNNILAIDPHNYKWCNCCGHSELCSSNVPMGREREAKCVSLLSDNLYVFTDQQGFNLCDKCSRCLNSGRIPKNALSRGWPLGKKTPTQLASLSKHERLLISLRLPCVYTWRSQGGYGQYSHRGAPVSFSNPVSKLAGTLPRFPSAVFQVYLSKGVRIEVSAGRVKNALHWLREHNPLYGEVLFNEQALEEIVSIERTQQKQCHDDGVIQNEDITESALQAAEQDEHNKGSHGYLDAEATLHLKAISPCGIEFVENTKAASDLIRHMLRPFSFRRNDIIPTWDATSHLEFYFPVLFPYGTGGPQCLHIHLADWIKNVLLVHESPFAKDLDFIFFTHAVLRRRRLTGLSANAPIRNRCSKAIVGIRELISSEATDQHITERIEFLIRSGTLSASFETLRGTPAYWSSLKKRAWTYLTFFGPCQVFITVSAADVVDPYVFIQIDPKLSYEGARNLNSQQRATLLAENPVAACTIFHRRIQSVFNNFLFGHTRPFGEINAFLGRIEQQQRLSPHLHLLVWTKKTVPSSQGTTDSTDSASETEVAKWTNNFSEFVELFCTARLPPNSPSTQPPIPHSSFQINPPALDDLRQSLISNEDSTFYLYGAQRHAALSAPYSRFDLDGSKESNELLKRQIMSCQMHKCQHYCLRGGLKCRFSFPYPIQSRAGIARKSRDTRDPRRIALAPRDHPLINSTHPMLTAMLRSNTDVTLITGNSIAECMYVCSYAVKSEKLPVFDKKSLERIRTLLQKGKINDDRSFLSAIVRNSETVKTVGGQEAVDNLLGNPLIFQSAIMHDVSTAFILSTEEALTQEERQSYFPEPNKHTEDLLPLLDQDSVVSIKLRASRHRPDQANLKDSPPILTASAPLIIQHYACRPNVLVNLTASQFFANYSVSNTTRKLSEENPDMKLQHGYLGYNHTDGGTQIVRKRKSDMNRPSRSHILNVPYRGKAKLEDPYFAAASLLLHIPFRSLNDLLDGKPVTVRLKELMARSEEHPELRIYVTRCQDLSEVLSIQSNFRERLVMKASQHIHVPQQTTEQPDITLLDDLNDVAASTPAVMTNPLCGLPPLLAAMNDADPFSIATEWSGTPSDDPVQELQPDVFRKYLSECKSVGVSFANKHILETASLRFPTSNFPENENATELTGALSSGNECRNRMEMKRDILQSCRNEEQRCWLNSVMSYIEFYYSDPEDSPPRQLVSECRRNKPILTNAPGGSGKSWLVSQLKKFIERCVPIDCRPVWSHYDFNEDGSISNLQSRTDEELFVSLEEFPIGRLGRVAIFAPSGVAAANCGGQTIHSAMRASVISLSCLNPEVPGQNVLQNLIRDFARVVCIVIDEYSMVSLLLLAYLDKVTRLVRPAYAAIPFGGIPIILTGDSYQLQAVNSLSILSDESSIRNEQLLSVYQHLVSEAYYMELTESIRQDGDSLFANLLMRLRLQHCTQADADLLNTRFYSDLNALADENPEWTFAPILTARNATVRALNRAAIVRNGRRVGTFHLHNMPSTLQAKNQSMLDKKLKRFYGQQQKYVSGDRFSPEPRMVLYPGIPLMLRVNLCPALGLCNGSLGRLHSIIQNGQIIQSREDVKHVVERIMDSNISPPAVPSIVMEVSTCYKGLVGTFASSNLGQDKKILVDPYSFTDIRGIPVSVAHAITMHKAQSLTLPYCIIDPREVFCLGALYVAFSRPPCLQRVALIDRVTVQLLNKYKRATGRITRKLASIKTHGKSLRPFVEFVNNSCSDQDLEFTS